MKKTKSIRNSLGSKASKGSNLKVKKNLEKFSFMDRANELVEDEGISNMNSFSNSKKTKISSQSKNEENSRSSKKQKELINNNSEKLIIYKVKRNVTFNEKLNKKSKNKRAKNLEENSSNSDDEKNSLDSALNSNFLNNLSSILNFNTNHSNLQKNSKSNIQFESCKEFPYDHSLLKQLDIEIIFETKEKQNEFVDSIPTILEQIEKYFDSNKFDYYEYSNPRGRKNSINSQIDNVNYDFLYEKNLNFNLGLVNEENNKNLKTIKSINYISAMSSVFGQYTSKNFDEMESDSFFYFITPMLSFYFFKYENNFLFQNSNQEIEESGVLISYITKSFEKNLKDNGIVFEKLQNSQETITKSKKKKNSSNIPLLSITHATSEQDMDNLYTADNSNASHNSSVYICSYYKTLLFNMLLNDYEDSSLNVYSPYSFEYSTFRQCKVMINTQWKDDKKFIINIKIFGCLFQTYLAKIINFLSEKNFIDKKLSKTCKYSFSTKFHHFMKTGSFYIMNKNLKNVIDVIKFQDSKFSIKYKS